MKTKNGNMPAIPTKLTEYTHKGVAFEQEYEGMTKREMIAMHAMSAMISSGSYDKFVERGINELAVIHADTLLRELEK